MKDDKKNAYRFTLQFNQNDPRHARAVGILNQQGKSISQFITSAVLHYIDCTMQPLDTTLRAQEIENFVNMIVKKTVEALDRSHGSQPVAAPVAARKKAESAAATQPEPFSEQDKSSLLNAMKAFK